MPQAKKGDVIKVHYTAKLEDGTIFDSSMDREPLEFTIGEGKVIPAFEQAVIDMNPGESKTEKVPADRAFGPHRKELVQEVDRQQVSPDLKLEVGNRFQIPLENGRTMQVRIADISESKVTLDANHPLAGKDLILDIQLLEIV